MCFVKLAKGTDTGYRLHELASKLSPVGGQDPFGIIGSTQRVRCLPGYLHQTLIRERQRPPIGEWEPSMQMGGVQRAAVAANRVFDTLAKMDRRRRNAGDTHRFCIVSVLQPASGSQRRIEARCEVNVWMYRIIIIAEGRS